MINGFVALQVVSVAAVSVVLVINIAAHRGLVEGLAVLKVWAVLVVMVANLGVATLKITVNLPNSLFQATRESGAPHQKDQD